MHDPRFFPLLLHRLPELGAATYHKLLALYSYAECVFQRSPESLRPLLRPAALSALSDYQANPQGSTLAQQVWADLAWLDTQPDVHLLLMGSPDYPPLLAEIPRFPPVLYVRGNLHTLSLPQVAIVGSRNPSVGGVDNALRFAEFLAANGFVITSGLALGVDAAAHQGALNAGGKTIAVMGTGIDRLYPTAHRAMAQAILDKGGALVSEFPLGASAQAAHFPQRNRIISGLSGGVLVVEAAVKSGSLITAELALQQGREVFAIPGSIHNPLARGCHRLIRQGATLVETAQDIVDQLQGNLGYMREVLETMHKKSDKKTGLDQQELSHLAPAEQQLIAAMGYDPVTVDDLSERLQMPVGRLSAQLISLEIKGLVQQLGASYQRVCVSEA